MIARVDGRPANAVPIGDRGLLHGDSVFELVRVVGGRPFLLPWHRERLEAGLRAFRFGEVSRVWAEVDAVLGEAGVRDGALRILVTRGEGSLRTRLASGAPRTIVVFEEREFADVAPLRACIVDAPRVSAALPSATAKYARYLPYLLANDDARARGFDEALLLAEDGSVAEAATANVFAVVGDVLVTPPLSGGILAGVTRRWVVESAGRIGLRLEERPIARESLGHAEELFLTSSLRGIAPVSRVDERELAAPGAVTNRVLAAHAAATVSP